MKPHLPLLLLSALLSAFSASAESMSYIVDGVDATDLIQSERFYDVGKGYYWSGTGEEIYKNAGTLYKESGNSFTFLGDLAPRISGKTFGPAAFAPLIADDQTCGYQVPANQIQYWLSYYGVFYTGKEPLAYGLTYSNEYLEKLGGTQSLSVGMLFYDSWKNAANNLELVGDWYFRGEVPDNLQWMVTSPGGWFREYYAEERPVTSLIFSTALNYSNSRPVGLKSYTHELMQAFALEDMGGGVYSQSAPGQLAYLGLKPVGKEEIDNAPGHALTCYGLETDEDGLLRSLKVTNSDDREFALLTLYVKENAKGFISLYTDAACTELWSYSNEVWSIAGLQYINTPEHLVDLYEAYNAPDTPLTWTGSRTEWVSNYQFATTAALPTAETGWAVHLAGQEFHSYFSLDRPLCFDDSAVSTEVRLVENAKIGSFAPKEVHLNNSDKDYLFVGDGSTRFQPESLIINGAGTATFRDILLATGDIAYETYRLNISTGARLTASGATIGRHGTLELSGGSVNIPILTFNEHATLRVSSVSQLSGALTLQAGSVFDCLLTPMQADTALLSVSGSLTLGGTVKLEIEGEGLTEGARYLVCSVSEGRVDTASFFTEHGTLSFSDHGLWLTYREVPAYTWTGGDGKWSSSVFGTTSHNTIHADIEFERGRGEITLIGKVTPHHLSLHSGSYLFKGAGASIDCEGYVNLDGNAELTLDVPVSAEGIILEDEASLTLETGKDSELSYISATEHTHLNFLGAVTYQLDDAGVLAGAISIGDGTTLDFRLSHDEYLEGDVTSLSDASALLFENASALRDIIIYEADNHLEKFSGSITIGREDSAHRTTLSVDTAPARGHYILSSSGLLEIQDSCELATSISGSGTLVIGAAAEVQAAVSDGKASFADTLDLDVHGSLKIGSQTSRLSGSPAHDISVSGHLEVHVQDGSTLNCNSMTLNGGTYTYYTADGRGDVIHNIDTLHVGKKGGTISRVLEAQSAYSYAGMMNIGSLTGEGNLCLHGEHFYQLSGYSIAGVGAGGFSGDIHVDNIGNYYDGQYHLTLLELGAGVYGGSAMITNSVDDEHSRSALGLLGDVTLRGLESEDWGMAYLYSGQLKTTRLDSSQAGPAAMIEAETHTLTLNPDKNFHYYGEVLSSLNLVKTGKGTQSFLGDMSAFSGSLRVSEGTLALGQDVTASSVTVENEARLESAAALNINGALSMNSGVLTAQALTSSSATFCGNSVVQADSIISTGAWTLQVTQDNLHSALVELLSLSGDGTLNLSSLDVRYDTREVSAATYCLLTLGSDFATQLQDLSIQQNGAAVSIGKPGTSPLYLSRLSGGEYELLLDIADGTAPLPRGEVAELVWQPASGVWSVGTGETSGAWESEHENANFHNGDEVIFESPASVTISGYVSPGAMSVRHASGTVSWQASVGSPSGITGAATLVKEGAGTLVLKSANSFTGGAELKAGVVNLEHASALGTGTISLSGGTLNMGSNAVTNAITATGGTLSGTAYAGRLTIEGDVTYSGAVKAAALNLKSGTLHADISTGKVGTLNLTGGALDGSLALDGGNINFDSEPLSLTGSLTLSKVTHVALSAYTGVGTYTLVSAGSVSGSEDYLDYTKVSGRRGYDISISGNQLLLTVTQLANNLTWTDAKGTWTAGCRIGGTAFETGDIVNFRSAAAVTISGRVAPGEIIVDSAANVSFTADKKVLGSGISGEGSLTKSGAGMLTMNAGNTYTGGTTLNAGTLKATADDSFGTGDIVINGGTLDLGSKAVANDIVLCGTATLKGDAKYVGNVSVDGNATLLAKTSYTGTTTIDSGSTLTLAAAATMAGSIVVDGGTLCITAPKGMTLAKNKTLILSSGGTVSGLLTIGAGSTLLWESGHFDDKVPVLSGGTLDLGGSKTLMLTGAKAQVQFGDRSVDLLAKSYVKSEESLLVKGGTVTVNDFGGSSAELIVSGGTLTLSTGKLASANTIRVTGDAAVVNGATHSGAIIVEGSLTKATNIKLTEASQRVELNGSGAMLGSIAGTGVVEVNGSVDITSGKLANTNILLNGTLTHAKGWTLAKGQTLTLGGGSMNGMLTIGAGAVLDMNGHSLPDAPVLKGGTADMGGTHTLTLTGNKGLISMDSQDFSLMAKSLVKSDESLIVKGGAVTVNDFGGSSAEVVVSGGTLTLSTGKLASANTIRVTGDAAVVNGATHSGAIIVEGSLTKATNIKLTDATQRVELNGSGAMLGSIAGTGVVEVNGSVDITSGKLSNTNILLNGTLTHAKGWTLAKGQTLTLGGGSMNGMLTIGAGAVLDMNGYSLPDAPVLKGGTADIGGAHTLTLTGNKGLISMDGQDFSLMAKSFVKSDDSLIVKGGAVTVNDFGGSSAEVVVSGGTLTLSTGKLASANTIRVTGDAAVVNGATHNGAIIVEGSLTKATNIKLTDATQRVSLNGEGALLGTIAGTGIVDVNASIDATAAKITATQLNLNSGLYSNTKGLAVAKGQTLTLAGAALNLGPKGTLSTAVGSTLVVNTPTTLTGNLTFGGGELVFAGGTLDVSGTLTLSKPMTVTNGGVITYGTLKPFRGDIAALFGGADVELDEESCTITLNGGVARRTRSASSPLATAAEAPVMAAALDAAPAPLILLPETNPVADAMVQADWGIIDAERAFMGAVNSRRQHAALLDKGRGAAWVSAFGSAVRHGSKGAHHGSDGNIEGAAFGLEHAVSETGSLGLAVGRSKNRIATTGVTHLRQETAHVALYGQKQLAHGFTADAAAAYGDTETKLGSASWTQKSAALTARLTHAQQLTDATAFRSFGGFSYDATDAGSIATAHTGSVQNLRAELGAGITHTAGKAHFYAEAALTGDLLRHNPTADLDGTRTHGANPGRLGIRATIGGLYSFTDTWSGTASYGIETESRSTSHTLNIGVSKTF